MARLTRLQGSKITLGNLKVGRQLGEGGFGIVHEATIEGINFPFAIKFLDPSPFNSDASAARERFFQEAELLFKLRHPNIVAIYGVGEHGGRPYILMERFPGMDLHRVREKLGTPDPEAVLPFVENVASALGYAHTKEIVHRDIKPRNLMALKGDGRVLDFGIAAALDPEGTRLTRTGSTCVGDAFSAPELVENPRLLDPRCDVYSLGACWFWLLTSRAPKGLNWEAALRSTVKVSPDYEHVLLRCLSQADSRYASMDDLVQDVRALRAKDKPRASTGALTDDDVLVLGTIASLCPEPGSSTNFYQVEQTMQGVVNRVAMGVANRRLLRLGFIEGLKESDYDGNTINVFRLSQSGERWVEANQSRITALMYDRKPPPTSTGTPAPPADDDIPF